MNDRDRVLFIVNPRSAGGATAARWEREIRPLVASRFGEAAAWTLTEAPGHAAALAGQAWREGTGMVVAVGGDGTLNEVANGLIAARGAGDPPLLGIVANGTGCDFARSIGVSKDPTQALGVLEARNWTPADACEIACTSHEGAPMRRFAVNTCGCGMGGEIAARVNRRGWPQHGFLAFLAATLRSVVHYRPPLVSISADLGPPSETRLMDLFVCNGQYCGGGMRPGRDARIDDGVLRVVEIGQISLPRIAAQLRHLYSGHLEGIRGVRVYDARRIDVTGPPGVLVDADGEQPGVLPVSFTVVPAALRIVVGPSPAAREPSAQTREPE